MAQLQTMAGRAVTSPITLIQGGGMPLKLVPGGNERLPFAVTTAAQAIAAVDALNNRTGPNFTTFTLRGGAPGQTALNIQSANAVATGPFAVRVLARIALPAAATNEGLLVRLFLAEAPGPGVAGATDATSTEAMTLMRVVLENRLATPSGRWGSDGATSMGDVVRARGQFEGFSGYPALPAGVSSRIENMVAIANDSGDGRQAAMRAHVERAIAVASAPRPADPTPTGLYWWRTAGSGAPGTGVTVYKTLLGNSFYREGQ